MIKYYDRFIVTIRRRCGILKKYIKIFNLICIAFCVMLLSGCMSKSPDSLYRLPQLPDEFVQIQAVVDEILSAGADYAAPQSGDNRQSVQLHDLDGDGSDEVIAFFRSSGDDKPLKIYIFKYAEENYNNIAVIEGEGTNIDSIVYEDMDGDGNNEVIVGWQMSAGVKMLSVFSGTDYTVRGNGIAYTDYTMYDIQNTGNKELITVNLVGVETQGDVIAHSLMPDGELVSYTAKLTMGAETVQRLRTAPLGDGKPGIYVECNIGGNSTVTDIFAFKNESIVNIVTQPEKGEKTVTERVYNIYCTDIDGDGSLEVPAPVAMPGQTETVYYYINWNSFNSKGESETVCSTYHNYADGWYFKFPEAWDKDEITVRREDSVTGERAIIFSIVTGNEEYKDFLKISALTGETREKIAEEESRIVLHTGSDTIFTGTIVGRTADTGVFLNESIVEKNFGRHYSDWVTGS